jgi:hypothetical protein
VGDDGVGPGPHLKMPWPLGRVLNYGELQIQSAGENDGLIIKGVPDVEDIQRDVYKFIEADEQRRRGGGNQLPPNAAT